MAGEWTNLLVTSYKIYNWLAFHGHGPWNAHLLIYWCSILLAGKAASLRLNPLKENKMEKKTLRDSHADTLFWHTVWKYWYLYIYILYILTYSDISLSNISLSNISLSYHYHLTIYHYHYHYFDISPSIHLSITILTYITDILPWHWHRTQDIPWKSPSLEAASMPPWAPTPSSRCPEIPTWPRPPGAWKGWNLTPRHGKPWMRLGLGPKKRGKIHGQGAKILENIDDKPFLCVFLRVSWPNLKLNRRLGMFQKHII